MDDEGTTAGPIARRALLAGAVVGAVARPALLRAQSETRLRLAHALPSSHPVHAAMEGMVAEIEARSGGAIRVALFANGELGDEVELMENARTGALDIVKLSARRRRAGRAGLPGVQPALPVPRPGPLPGRRDGGGR